MTETEEQNEQPSLVELVIEEGTNFPPVPGLTDEGSPLVTATEAVTEGVEVMAHLTKGDVGGAIEVFDDNKDGRISWSEWKKHKWAVAFILANVLSAVIGNLYDEMDFVRQHWQAAMAIIGAFLLGGFMMALFYPEPKPDEAPPESEPVQSD